MNEVEQVVVKRIVKRIFADANNRMSSEYFLVLRYKAFQFKDMIDESSFKSVLGFLPNMKHNHQPFIMSVSYNKGTTEFEITVINPRTKV